VASPSSRLVTIEAGGKGYSPAVPDVEPLADVVVAPSASVAPERAPRSRSHATTLTSPFSP
jgi:hypothetical protein